MRQLSVLWTLISVVTASLPQEGLDTTVTPLQAREDTVPDTFGFLKVECDSTGLDIFVDGLLVGKIPIEVPIPLLPGEHTVTYLHPEYLGLLKEHYGQKEIEKLTSRSFQKIYVVPRQTVSVNLWWRPYEQQLRIRKRWLWFKSLVGAVILATLFSLNVQ